MYKKKSKYTYLNLAEEVIREAKKPLTIAQIWRLGERECSCARLRKF